MSSSVKERFRGEFMAADTTLTLSGAGGIAGFLATTSGTITVTVQNGAAASSVSTVTVVSVVRVTEGVFTPIPLDFPQLGGTVTLAGGASGTLFI